MIIRVKNKPYRFEDRYMIAVSGSRNISDFEAVKTEIYYLVNLLEDGGIDMEDIAFVSGGAKGVDSFVRRIVEETHPFKLVEILPDWKKYGRGAAMVRNKHIIDSADMLIAFPNNSSAGTMATIKLAKKKGIPVVTIPFTDGKKMSEIELQEKHWEKFVQEIGLGTLYPDK